ncbi:MYXO-CTERM sorting domain-containing protein [Nannocystis punicea]|uniref:MYXO-CTERM sorting domain-containing protein n=1 Tax=Nannocystis punicea TaxID=2995304 RepID=A0ABY7HGC9_9BACT|nr:MYXO-CTERM sorting domain-containing protein [Nannocystis poenicansa]WAS98163.1 MYXO-CTERM sorting domain-containing protein [Nannocystis poenicansa]
MTWSLQRKLSVVAATLLLATASRSAHADAISEPPSCPEGTTPGGCHGGEYCDPNTCVDDSNCSEGKVCMEVERCADTVSCGGGLTSTGGGYTADNVLGACGEGDSCAVGTCRSFKLCVSETGQTTGDGTGTSQGSDSDSASGGTPPKKDGCEGCRAGDDGALPLLALGLLGLVIRRRSQRRS